MSEIGPRWSVNRPQNIETMIERFSEVLRQSPRDDVASMRDVTYGTHPRQQLDVYGSDPSGKRAVVVFVHGGAFMDGHRNRTDMVYSNVPVYFARHGIVGINVGYRLGGDAGYPGRPRTLRAPSAGRPPMPGTSGSTMARIFLMGHSAGAAHTQQLRLRQAAAPPRRALASPAISSSAAASGRKTLPENPNGEKVAKYYGTSDAARLDDLSPVTHVDAGSVPTLVAWGEFENPLIDVHCAELGFPPLAGQAAQPADGLAARPQPHLDHGAYRHGRRTARRSPCWISSNIPADPRLRRTRRNRPPGYAFCGGMNSFPVGTKSFV